MRARQVIALVAALLMLPVAVAWAGPPTDQLRAHVDRALRALDDPELRKDATQRRGAIRKIANDIFDFTETTRRSLGRHWQARTPAEREQIVQLFGDLLERAYIGKIELYSGEKIGYVGETVEGHQATVRTRLVTTGGTQIPVDYRMHRRGDRWLAYDVSIEGVSLVANYRTQFNKIIQGGSYQDLVKKLEAKLAEPPEEPEPRKQASRK